MFCMFYTYLPPRVCFKQIYKNISRQLLFNLILSGISLNSHIYFFVPQFARVRTSETMWPTSSRWRTAPSSRATWRFYSCSRPRLRTSGVLATRSCKWWPTMCCCLGSMAWRPSAICSPTWPWSVATTSSSTTRSWSTRCCSWRRWASTASWISPVALWGSRRTRTCATWPHWTGPRSWIRSRITTSWPIRKIESVGTCALARPKVRPSAHKTPSTATSGDAAGLRVTAREVSA